MVVEDVFVSQERVNSLQMVWQSIVGAAKIEPLIFNARPEIPVPGNVKAMGVAEIIVERVAVAENPPIVLKIALTGVKSLVGKKLG